MIILTYAETNVKLTRPAHDAWGIKKIVFNFCDDFLTKVLDLPWGQAEEWRALLLPIYQAIGIREDQVNISQSSQILYIK